MVQRSPKPFSKCTAIQEPGNTMKLLILVMPQNSYIAHLQEASTNKNEGQKNSICTSQLENKVKSGDIAELLFQRYPCQKL